MGTIRFSPILRSVTLSLHRAPLCRTGLLAPSLALLVLLLLAGPAVRPPVGVSFDELWEELAAEGENNRV